MGDRESPQDRLPYWCFLGQKIPDWLVKVTLLEKAQTAAKSGMKSRFDVV